MITHARHDYVELIVVYVGAVAALLFLTTLTTPRVVSRLGVLAPVAEKTLSMYDTKAFRGLPVQAKAYVVYDIVDGHLISSKNQDEVLPLASITKIMTAVSALAHHQTSDPVVISPASVADGYDLGLKKNQTWKLGELLKYTLVFSSNDGAESIATSFGGREAFVEQMNTDALLLGLALHFTDPAGLDIAGKLGGEGSALQVAKLFAIARKRFPEILDATTRVRTNVTASTGKVTGIPNTNQDIQNLLGAEASKTGFTDSAGGNLAVVVDISVGHPVVIVVLGSTRDERFSDVETLYKALTKSLVVEEVSAKSANVR